MHFLLFENASKMHIFLEGHQKQRIAQEAYQNDDQIQDDVTPIGIVITMIGISALITALIHVAADEV